MFYQVQYEELQADETDFPDELYVIPRSASDELTPQLLTPERERRERNVQMPTQQVQNTINQSRGKVLCKLNLTCMLHHFQYFRF